MKKVNKKFVLVMFALLLIGSVFILFLEHRKSLSKSEAQRACQRALQAHQNYKGPPGVDELTYDDYLCTQEH